MIQILALIILYNILLIVKIKRSKRVTLIRQKLLFLIENTIIIKVNINSIDLKIQKKFFEFIN